MQIHMFLWSAGQCDVSLNETGLAVCFFLVELGHAHFLSTRLCVFFLEKRKVLMNLQSQVHLRSACPRIRNSKSELSWIYMDTMSRIIMGQRYLHARRSTTLVSIIFSHRCVNVLPVREWRVPNATPKTSPELQKNI